MNRGGEISASIPNDLIIEIFSRLPEKSAARFRSYGGTNLKCEDIPSPFPYNFTTSSRSSPFIFHRAVFDQLQNQNKKSSLVAPVGIYMMSLDFDGFTSVRNTMLAYLNREGDHRKYLGSFLGFDPSDKRFKVLWIRMTGISAYKILTLGTGEMRWRNNQSSLNHEVLYYLALALSSSDSSHAHVLVCFDVRSEKFVY
ncbi:hypothetical protein F2Q70_00021405 [Brassica cretica]|uniref:F-box associated beta-propeller type 3 domain-containing protein n=1 Tax=Brassica cretica TaxID=69181 RepID=A0A8S9GH05_BRACR|nr:hypothetical protein F2Q70_00021405 [Brassica cretica]KAF2559175.1 hypothetical protein F2Q68_00014949 [Brassica cretica]